WTWMETATSICSWPVLRATTSSGTKTASGSRASDCRAGLLKKQLHAEFQHAGGSRSRHRAVGRRRFPRAIQPHRGVDAGERGVIDEVERFGAELQAGPVLEAEDLQQ